MQNLRCFMGFMCVCAVLPMEMMMLHVADTATLQTYFGDKANVNSKKGGDMRTVEMLHGMTRDKSSAAMANTSRV